MVLARGFEYVETYDERNGCCDRPFILTRCCDGGAYSCQCSCGLWCTTGFFNPTDAVEEYRRMTRKWFETHDRPSHYDEEDY